MTEAPPLRFEQLTIVTRAGERTALVVTPTRRIQLGRERLAQLREGNRSSEVDEHVLRRIESADRTIDAVLLRSWESPEASWGFDDELDHDELMALGYHLMRGQLALFRRALVLGTSAVCSTDLTPRDFDAVLDGWRRLGRELRDKGELERNLKEETDLFLLDNFTLWTTRPLAEFRDEGLPAVLDLVQRHRDRLASLRERLAERARAIEAAIQT